MDKTIAGLIAILILSCLLVMSWVYNIDGVTTATLTGIIGLIAGAIFSFTYLFKKKL